MSIPLQEQIACIRREHALRTRVYPNLVATKRMTQAWADYQIEAMQAVLATLEQLQGSHESLMPGLFDRTEVPHEAEREA